MIRKRSDSISEEEFSKIIKPHNKLLDNYLENKMYDYVAFYLAKGYELSALWENKLTNHINSAIDTFSAIQFKNKFDYDRLKQILKEKYSLVIVNNETTTIKNI